MKTEISLCMAIMLDHPWQSLHVHVYTQYYRTTVLCDSDFDANWKEQVQRKVSSYGSMSESCEDDRLDTAVEKGEIVTCLRIIRRGEVMDQWLGNGVTRQIEGG